MNISGKSTIVYCATKKEVEDITAKIIQDLSHQLVQQHNNSSGGGVNAITIQQATPIASTFVKPYHAGLSQGDRSDAHTEFLIGKVTVIVATVAFGMVSAYQKSIRMHIICRTFEHLISYELNYNTRRYLHRGLTSQTSDVSFIGGHARPWKSTINKWAERDVTDCQRSA